MEFRIGINLGDVIEEGDRIYGEGVNLAAGIERIADPGNICISGSAYEQIKSKLALGYEDLGEKSVKNISEPIRVYRIPMESKVSSTVNKKSNPKRLQRIALTLIAGFILGVVSIVWYNYLKPLSREAARSVPAEKSVISIDKLGVDFKPGEEFIRDLDKTLEQVKKEVLNTLEELEDKTGRE